MAGDKFAAIKKALSGAQCVELEFVLVIESDIFDTIDSTQGSALLASDGRFVARLASDVYWQDSSHLYCYSNETNQVTVDKASRGDQGSSLPLVTHLDSLYVTKVLEKNHSYLLHRRAEIKGDIPDTMTVVIDTITNMITELSFRDINDELNRILIQKQITDAPCDPKRFEPDYPDSADVVRMY